MVKVRLILLLLLAVLKLCDSVQIRHSTCVTQLTQIPGLMHMKENDAKNSEQQQKRCKEYNLRKKGFTLSGKVANGYRCLKLFTRPKGIQ